VKGNMVLPPPLGTGLLTAALFYAVILRAPPNTGTVRASNALLSLFFGVAAALLQFLFSDGASAPKSRTGGTTLASHPSSYAYLLRHIGESGADRALREALERAPRARMLGAPDEAFFLKWLLEALNAKRAIEVGVFRGLTTLQLARGVGAGGEVHALDVDGSLLDAGGRAAWERAGVSGRIAFKEGPAAEALQALLDAGEAGKFDLVFIDADKANYEKYYELSLALLRAGGVIAVDNVLWSGRAERPAPGDEDSLAINALNAKIAQDPRVAAVMLGMADGLYLCRKL
jgi:predicted O-methyltransferase YrrM